MKDPAKLDLGDYLPYLANRVGAIIAEQFVEEALAAHRLSIAMWRVMVVLAGSGSQRQTDLAALTSIEASTLSRLVTRLVRLGLAQRARSTSSNREVAVSLSSKGKTLVAGLIPIAKRYEAAAIAGLTPNELTLLKRCLRRVYENMSNRPEARSGRASVHQDGASMRTRRPDRPRAAENKPRRPEFSQGAGGRKVLADVSQ